ncbi:BglG family transcription antiterminator [Gottfriedia solisilvae]|uniref:Ascorbate-specific PTS system EIIA component n=1 Tax=Gottfriedia solisilvae TaxID=1516104 RepID=A0A8J3ANY8_9BACI|nr:BglG family transcription antiterminator [Gottfriedia solisilvae]GGI18013.1 PTS sugar transporter subunit IIA [Gottfriedia solisilvae]
MFLDERSASLLQLLIQNSSTHTMSELEMQTGLTRRQLQYGISKVNNWLTSNGYRPVAFERKVGYFLPDPIREEDIPSKLTKKTYVFSESEREKVFLLMILLNSETLSIFHFQSITGVSRTTVLKDLSQIKGKIELLQLQIQYSKQNGYEIKGDNSIKRFLVEQLIYDVLHSDNANLIIECIWGFHSEQIRNVEVLLEEIEKHLDITFTDERLQELVFLILCTDQLLVKGETIENNHSWNQLNSTIEFKMVKKMTQSEVFEGSWNQTEQLYVTLHLLSKNRTKDISPFKEDRVIEDVLREIIEEFERLAFVHLKDKELLFQQLYIHFRPAYYRIMYSISSNNPLTKKVKKIYPELFHLTKKSLRPIEKLLGFSMLEDEVAYFTIHFGGWLRRQGTRLDERKRAIVVCPNGIGISNILVSTLRELFPDILFLDVLSIRDMANYSIQYDLVFSTVHLRTKLPLYVIPPILDIQEKQKLRQKVMHELYGFMPHQMEISALLQIISQFATIREPIKLEKSLQSYINNQTQNINKFSMEEAEKPVLKELLTLETIQLKPRVSDWRESISLAAKPLVELGTIEERYVDAMIESIEINGPYVVITPGVAIPHSRPEKGVRSLSMSLLKLDEEVEFSPDKKVRLIIVLAAADSESHLRALVQLTGLLNEPSNIEDILNSEDPSTIVNYINKYSEEETI